MKKLNATESKIIMQKFLDEVKTDLQKKKKKIEFMEFEVHEPNYIKHWCAYLQTDDKKNAVLFEATPQTCFYIKAIKMKTKTQEAEIEISVFDNSTINKILSQKMKTKLQQVSLGKKDDELLSSDFTLKYNLANPLKKVI